MRYTEKLTKYVMFWNDEVLPPDKEMIESDLKLLEKQIDDRHLEKISVPPHARLFKIYFRVTATINVKGKDIELVSKPIMMRIYRVDKKQDVSKQFVSACLTTPWPIQNITYGEDYVPKFRYVQKLYETAHPEFPSVEDRVVVSGQLQDILIPQWCEKTVTHGEYFMPIYVDGVKTYLKSAPINPTTYYVGTNATETNGVVTFIGREGNLCFAHMEDMIIDPRDINELGEYKAFNGDV